MNKNTVINVMSGWALALLLLPGTLLAAAPPELTGTWEGKLAVDPKTSLKVQFTFTKAANGAYTAVLNSPDNADIKNTVVTGVIWDGNNLKLQVPSLSGSYAGILKNGKIGGQWTQPGSTLALELAPFQKPVLDKAATETLAGTWTGPLKVPGGELTFVLRFKTNEGVLGGTLAVPEQGGREIPMAAVEFSNNKLSFKIPQVTGDFSATLANGVLNGTWTQGGAGLPVSLKKGDYKPKVAALKLSAESFAALKGKWQGTLDVPNPQTGKSTALPLVLRFETSDKGEYLGYVDSPSQGAKGLPVSDASLANGKLAIRIDAVKVEFAGALSGNTIVGEWAQPAVGLKAPLTLTR
ncbi:MAG: hypothetical protein ABI645_10210 [Pseudomonadota bacterium]